MLTKKIIVSSLEPLESRIAPATFTVINTNDAGAGSLRQAVLDANAHLGVDTITFKLPTDSIIGLAGGEIAITESVNILGPGAGKLTVSGMAASRIFNIDDSNSGSLQVVKISGLTLTNGNAALSGGAILDKETLTLQGCVVENSTATNDGGGLHISTSGKLTMISTKIIGNTASTGDGGGLYVSTGEGIQITNSVISGNKAGDQGGGLYGRVTGTPTNLKPVVLFAKTSFIGNTAANGGGGVWIRNNAIGADGMDHTKDDGVVIIQSSTFVGNRATAASVSGGGIYVLTGNVLVQSSSFIGNSAIAKGGGIAAGGAVDSLTIQSSRISGNSTSDAAQAGGGGLFLQAAFTTNIIASSFSGNRSASDGGGIVVTNGHTLKITSTVFTNNFALGDDGGAIYVDPAGGPTVSLDIKASKFFDNFAANDGAGLSAVGDATISVAGSVFAGGFAGDDSGAIDTTGAIGLTIKVTKFTGNVAIGEGGALYLRSTAAVSITGSTFTQNSAVGGNGGGISFGSSGTKSVMSSIFRDNSAHFGGGGIALFGAGTLNVISTTITGNVAKLKGGGIANYTGVPGRLVITTSKITDNSANADPQIHT